MSRTNKTICLAVSPSLKEHGIGGRPRLFEVERAVALINEERRLRAPGHRLRGRSVNADELAANPSLELGYIAAKPRMATYLNISAQIYGIYLKYASAQDIHVYSVDEVFIDATRYLKYYGCSAHELARKIVADICETTGITATAGIGTNMYLAKVAMDIVAKHIPAGPDGVRVAELNERSYRERLWAHRPLTDFWRVGPGIARKLQHHGLWTMGDIARCSLGSAGDYYNEDLLYSMFGVNAELLIDHAWGWEPCTIADIQAYAPRNSSLSSGQVLSEAYDFDRARVVITEMADQLALDLVARGATTDRIALAVGYDVANLKGTRGEQYLGEVKTDRLGRKRPKSAHASLGLGRFTSSAAAIREAASSLFYQVVDPELLVRRLNITACNVKDGRSQEYDQPDLFSLEDELDGAVSAEKNDEQKRDAQQLEVQKALLQVREKFGGNAVVKGVNLDKGATGMQRNGQIGGHAA